MTKSWSAVILAGGLGSRLNPLTAKICKPMVPVGNKPMVDYAIDHLRYAGIKKIIIVVKHLGDKLRNLIQTTWDSKRLAEIGLEVLVPHVDSKGTADAVRKVSHLIDTDNFVVSMADIVTNLPIREFMEFHEKKNAQATVSMKRIEEMATKYGNTLLDSESRIIRFLEKPSSEEIYLSALTGGASDPLPIINTGIYCFKHDILKLINSSDFMDFGKEVFPYLLEHRYSLYGFVRNYYWLDVGNPTTYLWSNWDVLRLYGYPITPYGTRQGNEHIWYLNNEKPTVSHDNFVCFGSDNHFGDNSYIHELSVIGSHCQIGSNTHISRSVIWDNCKIGNNVQIEQSVIADGCTIGDNCVIRSNSIIGPNATISSGITLDAQTIKEDSTIH
ncbi:MAG: NDP-sugar synthase [Candidatus Lokiarchaeota archaeon]|nr:NDP-sugar synthase [Candidatus Harpocratesius repetitus]